MDYLFVINMLNRHSMDSNVVNKYDKELIKFCKATQMLIVKGRLSNDRQNVCFTRDDATG